MLRLDHFADQVPRNPVDPMLVLLTVVGLVVLLAPVGAFLAAAVRFGGEARDRRLAALRLGGADRAGTARIAAGEALAGTLLGLPVGVGFFLIGRQLAQHVAVNGLSVFAADLVPQPAPAVSALAAVPVLAVLVTLVTMRRIADEPLAVLRGGRARRRIWWRLALPAAGAALLVQQRWRLNTVFGSPGGAVLIAALVLLLGGAAVLLPPLLERAGRALAPVAGPPAWQLAVGRINANPESAARPVTGIVVTVAGAIALQTLLGSLAAQRTAPIDALYQRDQSLLVAAFPGGGDQAAQYGDRLRTTPGVADATAYTRLDLRAAGGTGFRTGRVADCATLRTMADLPDCADGDVFTIAGLPGRVLTPRQQYTALGAPGSSWTAPAPRAPVSTRPSPGQVLPVEFLATPGALPAGLLHHQTATVELHPSPGLPDAEEQLRTDAALLDPATTVIRPATRAPDAAFDGLRRALTAGTVAVLALIGAGMLV
ncbi:hypothetical protein C7C46_18805, partial [Streptomyces tateyamensis]